MIEQIPDSPERAAPEAKPEPEAKPKTVLIANVKGGCGKTTVAATLVSALAAAGARVVLADADRQRSGLTWFGRRAAVERPVGALDWTRKTDIGAWAPPLAPETTDWLVIDAPGALKTGRMERLVALADFVLTPVMPSLFDAMAAQRFVLQVENLRRVRAGETEILMIANRLRQRGRATQDLSSFFARIEIEPAAEIEERAVYGQLAAHGLGLFDRDGAGLDPVKRQWLPLLRAMGLRVDALAAPERATRADIA